MSELSKCDIEGYLNDINIKSYCDFGLDSIIKNNEFDTSVFFSDIAYSHIINSKYDAYVSEILLELKNSSLINELKSDGVILFITSLCALKYLLKHTYEIFICRSLNYKIIDDKSCNIEELYTINYNKLLYIISDNLNNKLTDYFNNGPTECIEAYIAFNKILIKKMYSKFYNEVNNVDKNLRKKSYEDTYKFTNKLFNILSEITEINIQLIIELHKRYYCKLDKPVYFINDRLIKIYYDDDFDYINTLNNVTGFNDNEIYVQNLLPEKMSGHYKIFIEKLNKDFKLNTILLD